MARKRLNERDAQAILDQVRHQAGGALTGREARERAGLDPNEVSDDPPLDWRMTPTNVVLQIVAVVLFIGAAIFMVSLFVGGFSTLFGG